MYTACHVPSIQAKLNIEPFSRVIDERNIFLYGYIVSVTTL